MYCMNCGKPIETPVEPCPRCGCTFASNSPRRLPHSIGSHPRSLVQWLFRVGTVSMRSEPAR